MPRINGILFINIMYAHNKLHAQNIMRRRAFRTNIYVWFTIFILFNWFPYPMHTFSERQELSEILYISRFPTLQIFPGTPNIKTVFRPFLTAGSRASRSLLMPYLACPGILAISSTASSLSLEVERNSVCTERNQRHCCPIYKIATDFNWSFNRGTEEYICKMVSFVLWRFC